MESLSTLCYIENDGKYLMLHRNVKENDVNEGKWIGVGGHFEADGELNLWEGDRIFLRLLVERESFFSLKLVYDGHDRLVSAALDGKPMEL